MSLPTVRPNTRRLLILALVGVVSWKIFYPVVTQPLQTKREAIAKETRALESLQSRLDLYGGYMQQIRVAGKQCLQSDAMAAAIYYQEWLRGVCESVGISDPNITIKEPLPEVDVGAKIQVSMQSRASLAAVGELIDLLSSASIAQRLVKIDLKEWDTSSNQIGIAIELDALSLQDNPTYDSTLLSKTIEPRGFGSFIDQRRVFSRFVPPQPVIIETSESGSMSVSTEPIVAPRPDLLKTFMLVGVVNRDGNPRALFRDNNQHADVAVELNQELRVEDFAAQVAGIEGDKITLLHGQKVIQVSLGQSIREGLDAASDATIF